MLQINATRVHKNITGWWNADYANQTLDPASTDSTTSRTAPQQPSIETITTGIISQIIDVISDFD